MKTIFLACCFGIPPYRPLPLVYLEGGKAREGAEGNGNGKRKEEVDKGGLQREENRKRERARERERGNSCGLARQAVQKEAWPGSVFTV